jgi:hypothetical protein
MSSFPNAFFHTVCRTGKLIVEKMSQADVSNTRIIECPEVIEIAFQRLSPFETEHTRSDAVVFGPVGHESFEITVVFDDTQLAFRGFGKIGEVLALLECTLLYTKPIGGGTQLHKAE